MRAVSFLKNHFLIAMPALADPNFFRTVTYVCEHSPEGAMGIVVNRPVELRLRELFEHMEIGPAPEAIAAQPVYYGGPVQTERGFVLHRPVGHWQGTLAITDEMGLTTSRDILEAMARGEGPHQSLVALGYAGWGPGQLEKEMADNAWLSGPADPSLFFDLSPDHRWEAASMLLGIDIHRLSGQAGHA
jgi:putative transcriptional regulator